ncbi:MAG: hypothetical protein Q9160_001817 [Pyrenula sp. 1 TL-2023]
MSSPVHTPRPILQPIRRSFTTPIRPPPSSVQPPAQADPSDSAADILFKHPAVKIVAFSPPVSTYSSAPGRLRSASSPLASPNDCDCPVDAIETLPWYSTTEKTVASGLLVVEKVRGSACFLKCGQITQALMRNSQCWCVDNISKFVIRVRALTYYRIELPPDSEDDKAKIEEFKTALSKIIRYEKTPCPFKRGFKVDLPEEVRTPKKKRAWTPRKSLAEALPNISNRPQTAPEQQVDEIIARDKAAWTNNDNSYCVNNATRIDDSDTTDESATTSESEVSRTSHSPPFEPITPTPSKRLSKVQPVVDALEQELAKATEATRRQSLPVRRGSSYQDRAREQLAPLPSDSRPDISDTSSENQKQTEEIPPEVADFELEEAPLTALKGTPPDWPMSEPSQDASATESLSTANPSLEAVQGHPLTEASLEEDSSDSSRDHHLNHDLEMSLEEAPSAIAERTLYSDAEAEKASDPSLGLNSETYDLSQLAALPKLPSTARSESPNSSISRRATVSEDAQSIASSFASFHSATSLDFEDDPLTPSPPTFPSHSPFVHSTDSKSAISSPEHKRDISELTVTTLFPSSTADIATAETPVQSLQQTSPVYVLPTTSPMSDWPMVSSSSSTNPGAIGLRQRLLRPRRSLSPLPHPSTLSGSPQSRSSGKRLARAIIQKASAITLGKPIEMAAILLQVIGRIASGATVADLLSGDLFRRPTSNVAANDSESSDDEDDYGMPIRGRDRSRSQSNTRQSTAGTKTPSELD